MSRGIAARLTITFFRTSVTRASPRTISRRRSRGRLQAAWNLRASGLAADLCPAVFQRHRAVEDRLVVCRIRIDAEVALPLELKSRPVRRRRQRRLNLAV